MDKIFLVAFIAPVGSGKTYVARIISKKLGAVHVRTDDIRVELRKKGKAYSRAPRIARELAEKALKGGKSVVLDFDAYRPQKQKELKCIAKRFAARAVFIRIKTPEKLILKRLNEHRYSKRDLFQNAKEAIRVYYIRKSLHLRKNKLQNKPDFVIDNSRPLRSQIEKIIKKLGKS